MQHIIQLNKKSLLRRAFSAWLALIFLLGQIILPGMSSAQLTPLLPPAGSMLAPTAAFAPALIKGLRLDPSNALHFDFIIDQGDSVFEDDAFRIEAERLVKYFLATLTVPNDELWVNLSPHEKDRIIPENFGVTQMGRDLLAQDYILKQLTASLMYPEEELGKRFWKKVQKESYEKFGTSEIPVNSFNKVWIVPERAVVYEQDNMAFVVESRLKVMLERDYMAMKQHDVGADPRVRPISGNHGGLPLQDDSSSVASDIIREIIIPEIEREVNEGANFAQLRQIYHSMILAAWFKRNLHNNILNKIYADQNMVEGVDIEDKDAAQKIYEQYLEAFKKGVYDYIKEDYDPVSKDFIPRKYFSGGFEGPAIDRAMSVVSDDRYAHTLADQLSRSRLVNASIGLKPQVVDQAMEGDEFQLKEEVPIPLTSDQNLVKTEPSGFIIGGANPNEIFDHLDRLAGLDLNAFVVKDDGSVPYPLRERFKRHNESVQFIDKTHLDFAEPLFYVLNLYNRYGQGKPLFSVSFVHHGTKFMADIDFISPQRQAPFDRHLLIPHMRVLLTNLENHKVLEFGSDYPYYIARYGYYRDLTPGDVNEVVLVDHAMANDYQSTQDYFLADQAQAPQDYPFRDWGLRNGPLSTGQGLYKKYLTDELTASGLEFHEADLLSNALVRANDGVLEYLVEIGYLNQGSAIKIQATAEDISLEGLVAKLKEDKAKYEQNEELSADQRKRALGYLFGRLFTYKRFEDFRKNFSRTLTLRAAEKNFHPQWWAAIGSSAFERLKDELGESNAKQWIIGHPWDPYQSWLDLLTRLGMKYQKLLDEMGDYLAKQWIVGHPRNPYRDWKRLKARLGGDYKKLKDDMGESIAKYWIVGHPRDPYQAWQDVISGLGDDYQKLVDELKEFKAKEWIAHHPRDPYGSWTALLAKLGGDYQKLKDEMGEYNAKQWVVGHPQDPYKAFLESRGVLETQVADAAMLASLLGRTGWMRFLRSGFLTAALTLGAGSELLGQNSGFQDGFVGNHRLQIEIKATFDVDIRDALNGLMTTLNVALKEEQIKQLMGRIYEQNPHLAGQAVVKAGQSLELRPVYRQMLRMHFDNVATTVTSSKDIIYLTNITDKRFAVLAGLNIAGGDTYINLDASLKTIAARLKQYEESEPTSWIRRGYVGKLLKEKNYAELIRYYVGTDQDHEEIHRANEAAFSQLFDREAFRKLIQGIELLEGYDEELLMDDLAAYLGSIAVNKDPKWPLFQSMIAEKSNDPADVIGRHYLNVDRVITHLILKNLEFDYKLFILQYRYQQHARRFGGQLRDYEKARIDTDTSLMFMRGEYSKPEHEEYYLGYLLSLPEGTLRKQAQKVLEKFYKGKVTPFDPGRIPQAVIDHGVQRLSGGDQAMLNKRLAVGSFEETRRSTGPFDELRAELVQRLPDGSPSQLEYFDERIVPDLGIIFDQDSTFMPQAVPLKELLKAEAGDFEMFDWIVYRLAEIQLEEVPPAIVDVNGFIEAIKSEKPQSSFDITHYGPSYYDDPLNKQLNKKWYSRTSQRIASVLETWMLNEDWRGKKVLEVAPGWDGTLVDWFKERGAEVTVIDRDWRGVRLARQLHGVNAKRADILELAQLNETYDLVVAASVLYYVLQNSPGGFRSTMAKLLDSLGGVINDRGHFVASFVRSTLSDGSVVDHRPPPLMRFAFRKIGLRELPVNEMFNGEILFFKRYTEQTELPGIDLAMTVFNGQLANGLEVQVHEATDSVRDQVAQSIIETIENNNARGEHSVIYMFTGRNGRETTNAFVRLAKQASLDLSLTTFFYLDEYYMGEQMNGGWKKDPRSYAYFASEHLLKALNDDGVTRLREDQVVVMDGSHPDAREEAREYERKLRLALEKKRLSAKGALAKADLMVMGVGSTGHLAFLEKAIIIDQAFLRAKASSDHKQKIRDFNQFVVSADVADLREAIEYIVTERQNLRASANYSKDLMAALEKRSGKYVDEEMLAALVEKLNQQSVTVYVEDLDRSSYQDVLERSGIMLEDLPFQVDVKDAADFYEQDSQPVELAFSTIVDNYADFTGSLNDMTGKALSIGFRNILQSQAVIVTSAGDRKAVDVLARLARLNASSYDLPLSAILRHGNAQIVLDRMAASRMAATAGQGGDAAMDAPDPVMAEQLTQQLVKRGFLETNAFIVQDEIVKSIERILGQITEPGQRKDESQQLIKMMMPVKEEDENFSGFHEAQRFIANTIVIMQPSEDDPHAETILRSRVSYELWRFYNDTTFLAGAFTSLRQLEEGLYTIDSKTQGLFEAVGFLNLADIQGVLVDYHMERKREALEAGEESKTNWEAAYDFDLGHLIFLAAHRDSRQAYKVLDLMSEGATLVDAVRAVEQGSDEAMAADATGAAAASIQVPFEVKSTATTTRQGRYDGLIDWLKYNPYLALDVEPSAAVVDVGASSGLTTIDLADAIGGFNPSLRVYGVDPGLHVGGARSQAPSAYAPIFIKDDHRLSQSPEIKEQIKVIVSANVFSHYNPSEQRMAAAEMADKLAEGGLLILGSGGQLPGHHMTFLVMQKIEGRLIPQELVLKESKIMTDKRLDLWANYMPLAEAEIFQPLLYDLWIQMTQSIQEFKKRSVRETRETGKSAPLDGDALLEEELMALQLKKVEFTRNGDGTVSIPLRQFSSDKAMASKGLPKDQWRPGDIVLLKEKKSEAKIIGINDMNWDGARRKVIRLDLTYAQGVYKEPQGYVLFDEAEKELKYLRHESASTHRVSHKGVDRAMAGETVRSKEFNVELLYGYRLSSVPTNFIKGDSISGLSSQTVGPDKPGGFSHFYLAKSQETRELFNLLFNQQLDDEEFKNIVPLLVMFAEDDHDSESIPIALAYYDDRRGFHEITAVSLSTHQMIDAWRFSLLFASKKSLMFHSVLPRGVVSSEQKTFFINRDNVTQFEMVDVLTDHYHEQYPRLEGYSTFEITFDGAQSSTQDEAMMTALPLTEFDNKLSQSLQTGQIFYASDKPIIELLFDLWFVRHGETFGNKDNIFQGDSDEPMNQLNETGTRQAEEAARQLYEKLAKKIEAGEEIVILVSPLTRAVETADAFIRLVKERSGRTLKAHVEPGAIEISFGVLNNKTRPQAINEGWGDLVNEVSNIRNASARPKGGQSFIGLLHRVRQWLQSLNERFAGKTVVVFGHGTFSSAVRVLLADPSLVEPAGHINWGSHYLLANAKPVLLSAPKDAAMAALRYDQIDYGKLDKKKPILVGANFDVVEGGKIKDPTKVIKGLEGLEHIDHPMVFVTHNGRPLTKGPQGLELDPIKDLIQERLPHKKVRLASGLTGATVADEIRNLKSDEVLVLTNFRLDPRAESANEAERKQLVREIVYGDQDEPLFSLFISNAFASAPRFDGPSPSTSLIDFPELLPSVAGPLMARELDMLAPIRNITKHPFALMTGGSKIGDKIDATLNPLKKMQKGDILIIYGQMAFTYLQARAELRGETIDLGNSLIEWDYIDKAKEILTLAQEKGVRVILPSDHIETDNIKKPSSEKTQLTTGINISQGLVGGDIGVDTIEEIADALLVVRLVFNNGTAGVYQRPELAEGTKMIAKLLALAQAAGVEVIVGGGDAVEALKLAGVDGQIEKQSSGGGSSLQIVGLKEGEEWSPIIALNEAAPRTRLALAAAIKDADLAMAPQLIAVEKKLADILRRLKANGNSPDDIEKVIGFLRSKSQLTRPFKEIILEVAGGDTRTAHALAKNNPNIAVITTDAYAADSTYANAKQYRAGSLIAQTEPLPNLAVVRMDIKDILESLPEGAIDHLLVVSPDIYVEPIFFDALKDENVLRKFKSVMIKPYSSLSHIAASQGHLADFERIEGQGFLFNGQLLFKNQGQIFSGVDMIANSYQGSKNDDGIWIARLDEAMSVQSDRFDPSHDPQARSDRPLQYQLVKGYLRALNAVNDLKVKPNVIFYAPISPVRMLDPKFVNMLIGQDTVLAIRGDDVIIDINGVKSDQYKSLFVAIDDFRNPSKDKATTADKYGGIDMNPDLLELETTGQGVEIQFDPAQLENLPITGFTPIIYSITPIVNLPLLLGIADDGEGEPLAHTSATVQLSKAIRDDKVIRESEDQVTGN